MSEERTLADGSVVETEADPDGALVVRWESGKPVGRIVPQDGGYRLYDPEGNEVLPADLPVTEDGAIEALCKAAEEAFWLDQH